MRPEGNSIDDSNKRKLAAAQYVGKQKINTKSQVQLVKKLSGKQLTKEQWDKLTGLN